MTLKPVPNPYRPVPSLYSGLDPCLDWRIALSNKEQKKASRFLTFEQSFYARSNLNYIAELPRFSSGIAAQSRPECSTPPKFRIRTRTIAVYLRIHQEKHIKIHRRSKAPFSCRIAVPGSRSHSPSQNDSTGIDHDSGRQAPLSTTKSHPALSRVFLGSLDASP